MLLATGRRLGCPKVSQLAFELLPATCFRQHLDLNLPLLSFHCHSASSLQYQDHSNHGSPLQPQARKRESTSIFELRHRFQHRSVRDEKDVQNTISQAPAGIASEEAVDQDAQAGVQRMQALATVWSKSNLIAAYTMYVYLPKPHTNFNIS